MVSMGSLFTMGTRHDFRVTLLKEELREEAERMAANALNSNPEKSNIR